MTLYGILQSCAVHVIKMHLALRMLVPTAQDHTHSRDQDNLVSKVGTYEVASRSTSQAAHNF